jgi:hypothetical protein
VQLELFLGVSGPTLRDVANTVRAAGVEGLGAQQRADAARYQEVRVRSALANVKGMPFSWALNPYRGCTHACEYCYARKYQRHLELGAGDDFSSLILVKTNLAETLRRELARPGWTHENVAVGTATDPYQPIEGYYRITRRCLEVLTESGTPFSIVTKGPMIVRDADVLGPRPRDHDGPHAGRADGPRDHGGRAARRRDVRGAARPRRAGALLRVPRTRVSASGRGLPPALRRQIATCRTCFRLPAGSP